MPATVAIPAAVRAPVHPEDTHRTEQPTPVASAPSATGSGSSSSALRVSDYLRCVLEGRPFPSPCACPDAAIPPTNETAEGLAHVAHGRAFAPAD